MSRKARGELALGFRAHLGWAAGVALAVEAGEARIVDRQRIELCDPDVPGSHEPYHVAEELGPARLVEAERAIRELSRVVERRARKSLRDWVRALERDGGRPVTSAILVGVGKPGSSLARTLASHAMVHTAEGILFREVLARASEACKLAVESYVERDIYATAAKELGVAEPRLRKRLDALGRELGPPWRQDQKLAAAGAWLALARA